ncbi:MAG TPA: helix-turn-helix domain-containing protein [Candidatus Eubacterium faecigallinarum]|nr:helix-turn-helix domain-containing protein [Candidatus Eubacterium faecigallinarum]
MLTDLGKELRRIRINNDEILKNMAAKLEITPAYLSAIENGKREPTKKFMDTLFKVYNVPCEEQKNLIQAFHSTIENVSINLSNQSQNRKDLGLVFARKFDGLSDDQIKKLIKILNKED